MQDTTTFTRRALIVTGLLLASLLLITIVWQLHSVFLLFFAAILIGVLLDGAGDLISRYTPFSRRFSIALFVIILIVFSTLFGMWVAPRLTDQAVQLRSQLMEAIDMLRQRVRSQGWLEQALQETPLSLSTLLNRSSGVFASVTGFLSGSLSIITDVLVMIVVGSYLAISPSPYQNGFVKLFPKGERDRIHLLLSRMGKTLQLWLIGRFSSMLIVGIMSAVGLTLLGVPLAILLGLLTALFAFVPVIGPAVALVPPVLLAFGQSPQLAFWVFLLYMGIQMIESYLLTPLIQKRAVEIPPVVLIMSQVALGLLFGFRGILLASPLAVTIIVAVKLLYIEAILDDHDVTYAAEKNDSD